MASDFYLRYYVGHKGKFGHEFLEFEFRPDGEGQGGGGGSGCGGTRSLRSREGAAVPGLSAPGRVRRWAGGRRGAGPAWRRSARGLTSVLSSPGKLRYANNSNYKNDVMIRKEVRERRPPLDCSAQSGAAGAECCGAGPLPGWWRRRR